MIDWFVDWTETLGVSTGWFVIVTVCLWFVASGVLGSIRFGLLLGPHKYHDTEAEHTAALGFPGCLLIPVEWGLVGPGIGFCAASIVMALLAPRGEPGELEGLRAIAPQIGNLFLVAPGLFLIWFAAVLAAVATKPKG